MTNHEIASQWLKAFNEHNLEKLLALYNSDAVHFSPKLKLLRPETNGFIKGKAELRFWWQDAFENIPSLNYKVTSLTANENRVFMEYIRTVENENDIQVAEVLEIYENKIVFSRVYHG